MTGNLQTLLSDILKDPEFWYENTKTDFSEELYRVMKENNMTSDELAKKLNCTPEFIQQILNDEIDLSISVMNNIASIFDCKVNICFTDK